jgi:hypothetical protein
MLKKVGLKIQDSKGQTMNLVFYEAVVDVQADRAAGEVSELMQWADPPNIGDRIMMSGDRAWFVVAVEAYQLSGQTVYIAMVSILGEPVPDRATWESTLMREYSPSLSLYLDLSPDGDVLSYGWRMRTAPNVGRLRGDEPTGNETAMRSTFRPWYRGRVETLQPVAESAYTAVHLCYCTPIQLPAAA